MALLHGDVNILNLVGSYIKKDNKSIDTISYLPEGKYHENYDEEFFNIDKSRVSVKIGRFVNKFIKKETFESLGIKSTDVENFVNLFKSYFTTDTDKLTIVEGDDILKWYLEENYTRPSGNKIGSLWNSCMRQSERNQFMKIYSDNKNVKMLIFLSDDGLLRTRALLWESVKDDNGNSYKFMDRIYSVYEHDTHLFKSWAFKNGYITKWDQSAKSPMSFDDNGKFFETTLYLKLLNHSQVFYPYFDTFKYYNSITGIFSNSELSEHQHKLVQSNGLRDKTLIESEEEYWEPEEEYLQTGEDDW